MPLIKPSIPALFDSDSDPEQVEPRAELVPSPNPNVLDVLREAGVDQRRGKSKMSPLLVSEGLGLEECARKLANFASYSEDEKIQYSAVQLALKLHGELDERDRQNSAVVINFGGVQPEMMQVLIPRS